MTKTCTKCNLIKPVSEFYKRKIVWSKDDGFDYYCKKCRNAAALKNYYSNNIKCTIDGCGKPNYARRMCKTHYNKSRVQEKREANE